MPKPRPPPKRFLMKYWRIIFDFALISAIGVVIFRNFFFSKEWPAGGDTLGWIAASYVLRDFRWLYMWRPHSFGFVESAGLSLKGLIFASILSLCKDPALTVKIFMFLSFLLAGFSIYAFTYNYTRRPTASFSASLTYILNRWFFSQFTEGHCDIIFSYALAPLIFLFVDRMLRRRKIKDVLVTGLMLSIMFTSFHMACLAIYGFFLILFMIFYVIFPKKHDDLFKRVKIFSTFLIPASLIALLLSAFQLLPIITGVKAYYYSVSFGYYIEDAMIYSYKNLMDAFTLRAVESWGYKSIIDVYKDLSLPDFPIESFLLIIYGLALLTSLFHRDRYTVFFAFSALLSMFAAKGPNPPFGYIFTWMWIKVPYLDAFRAVSRMSMMTAFSHAFLISALTRDLTKYIREKRHAEKKKIYLEAEIRGENRVQKVLVSINILNKIVRYMHKILYYLCILLLISILLSGFLSCTYFFTQGLQVYTPPKSYLEPYIWLANVSGDYKIVTVNNGPEEWEGSMNPRSDFAFSAMKTSLGWGHDIGYDSSFIHDKPVLQNGGWNPLTRGFINYLRFYLVRERLTKNLFKMLGPFNYKYIVLPTYLVEATRNFFLNQRGYHVVFNQSSIILENSYYTPRFFATKHCSLIFGGLESFASLSKIEGFNFNQTALIFANQMNDPFTLNGVTRILEDIIFVNSNITDAVMLSLKNRASVFIYAGEYGFPSLNRNKYWVSSDYWSKLGCLVLGGCTLSTAGANKISISFIIDEEGNYEIWLRVAFADKRGKLSISIDDAKIGEIQPTSSFKLGLKWVKINSLKLESGKHTLTLMNDGKGYNDIDAIAIIKQGSFQQEMNNLLNNLKKYPGRIIYVLEAEKTFTQNLPSNWEISPKTYEDFFIYLKDIGVNVAPLGNASASSCQFDKKWNITLWPHLANDGNLHTRWASKPGKPAPQWLMIEWDEPQEIYGVHIFFERAIAENYTIQTWNGTAWIDQVSVKGNTMLERMHIFKKPVKTSKIRVFITALSRLYNLASIYELEAYSFPQPASTQIFIPKEGRYVFAIRSIKNQSLGAPYLRVDNETIPLKQLNLTDDVQWYQSSPVSLKVGEHVINIGALNSLESINLDQLLIYSLKNDEEKLNLNNLFSRKHELKVSYEKVNPCEYEVSIENSASPFILVFSESYHPLWKAYLDDEETPSIPVYSLVNGFYINKTGSFHLKIYFTGQTYANTGLEISAITLISVTIVLLLPQAIIERWKKSLMKTLKSIFKETT